MIERITFDTLGWHEHDNQGKQDWLVWGNAGDVLSLAVVPAPRGTFKLIERDQWLQVARKMAEPGGIVSVDACTTASRPAIKIIYKRADGMGYRYTGILALEFREYWCQITVVSGERGTTGLREALLTDRLLRDGHIEIRLHPFYLRPFKHSSGYVKGWFIDPYDAKYKGVVLHSVADDEKYDEQFPHHPLSRVRSTLRTVRDSLQIAE